MNCFHFSNGERREEDDGGGNGDGGIVGSRASSRVSWTRSLSVASSNVDTRQSEFDLESRDFSDSAASFYEFLTQRRSNDLRVFSFSELKLATRGFSRALLIGEGGFGCVYRGVVKFSNEANCGGEVKVDVAVKQLLCGAAASQR